MIESETEEVAAQVAQTLQVPPAGHGEGFLKGTLYESLLMDPFRDLS